MNKNQQRLIKKHVSKVKKILQKKITLRPVLASVKSSIRKSKIKSNFGLLKINAKNLAFKEVKPPKFLVIGAAKKTLTKQKAGAFIKISKTILLLKLPPKTSVLAAVFAVLWGMGAIGASFVNVGQGPSSYAGQSLALAPVVKSLAVVSSQNNPRVLGVATKAPAPVKTATVTLGYIQNVVDNQLNSLMASGKLKGQKGDKGDAANAPKGTSGLSYAPVYYYQPSLSQNFTGGSVLGASDLSATNLTVNKANITSANINGLTSSGTASLATSTVNGLLMVSGNLGIGTSSPLAPLQIEAASGSAVLVDKTSSAIDIGSKSALLLSNPDPTVNNYSILGFADTPDGLPTAKIGVQFTDRTNHYGDFVIGTRNVLGINEVVRVTSAGNVGIGTTTPASKLSVGGDINFTGNLYQNGVLVGTGGSSQWTTSGPDIYFTGGNVGVGTATPLAKLDVVSLPGTDVGDVVASFTSNDTWQSGFNVSNLSSGGSWSFMVGGSVNAAIGSSNFGYYNTNTHNFPFVMDYSNDNVYLAEASGKVGIGNTSPQAPLHINSNGAGLKTALILQNNDGVNGDQVGLDFGTASSNGFAGDRIAGVNNNNLYDLAFSTYNGSMKEAMRITANNKVGINTTSPNAILTVNGNINLGNAVLFNVASTSYASLFKVQSSGNVGINTASPSSQLTIQSISASSPLNIASSSGSTILYVSSAGTIGIGTTSLSTIDMFTIGGVTKSGIIINPVLNDLGGSTNVYGILNGPSVNKNEANFIRYDTQGSINSGFAVAAGYGLRVLDIGGPGTVGNDYGVYISNISSGTSTNYALYSAGGTNYFAGNVGIGTATPSSVLQVRKDVGGGVGPTLFIQNGGGGANSEARLDMSTYSNGTTSPNFRLSVVDDGNYSAHINFQNKIPGAVGNSLITRLYIQSNGNIGIGTTTPGTALTLQGISGTDLLEIASSTGSSMFHITQAGNVGVGLSSPSSRLTVMGATSATTTVYSTAGTGYSYVVPAGVTQIMVRTWGGGGGAGYKASSPAGGAGGGGGFAQATISVTPGETLLIDVAGGGGGGSTASGLGGTNGGGDGGPLNGSYDGSGGGGGYSAVRRSSTFLVQAGGGGGGGNSNTSSGGGAGGAGGGNSGGAGGGSNAGGAGTSSAGGSGGALTTCLGGASAQNGSLNQGGQGVHQDFCVVSGGGGGGGHYGGGGGGVAGGGSGSGGGGGGSDLVTGTSTFEIGASGSAAANTSDLYYGGGAGVGGSPGSPNGGPGSGGRVVVIPVPTSIMQVVDSSSNPLATFMDSGDVGIGTTTPTALFSLQGSSGTTNQLLDIASSSGASYMHITAGGNVGIGTTTPSATFAIQASSGVTPFKVSSSTGLGLLTLDVAGNLTTKGAMNANGSPDVSENVIISDHSISAGDVVMIDTSYNPATTTDDIYNQFAVTKATSTQNVLGIISTSPGLLINANPDVPADASISPLTLAGRVPVKVSLENGNIAAGDYLTISANLPGYAAKATSSGITIGQALGAFNSGDASATGIVMAFVKVGYKVIDQPSITAPWQQAFATASNELNTALKSVINETVHVFGGVLYASEGVFNRVFAREVHTDMLCVGQTCVTQAQFLQMVQQAGVSSVTSNNNSGSGNSSPQIPTPTSTDSSEVLGDSTSSPVSDSQTTGSGAQDNNQSDSVSSPGQ